jgi:hypothetical protein
MLTLINSHVAINILHININFLHVVINKSHVNIINLHVGINKWHVGGVKNIQPNTNSSTQFIPFYKNK